MGDDSSVTADYMDFAIPVVDPADETAVLYIVYILDSRTTISQLNSQLFLIILQALMVGLLISLLLSFLLSKAMTGPIEKLTAGAERVAAGDFSSQLPVESTDEIGILTGTFNEMAGVLQSTLAAVENERNKLDTLFLHMTDGVVAFDHDGKLIHRNPAAQAMLHRPIDSTCTYEDLFGSVYPFAENALEEMRRVKEMGLYGIKLHPDYQEFFIGDEAALPIYEEAEKLGLPIAFHTGRDPLSPNLVHCPPDVLGKIADFFPRLTIIAAHMGGMDMPQEAVKHLAGKKNVYFDTAFASHFLNAQELSELIHLHGVDKVFFATDCPWSTVPAEKALLEAADLTPAQRERIACRNAEELFSLTTPRKLGTIRENGPGKEIPMKKVLCALLAAASLALCAGCSRPDAQTLDLLQGYGNQTKLLHLNASSSQKAQRIEGFCQVLEDAEPLDKDFSLFAYYPDYFLQINQAGSGTVGAIVDVNGDYIDFYYLGEDVAEEPQLYRSHTTAADFKKLVHQN